MMDMANWRRLTQGTYSGTISPPSSLSAQISMNRANGTEEEGKRVRAGVAYLSSNLSQLSPLGCASLAIILSRRLSSCIWCLLFETGRQVLTYCAKVNESWIHPPVSPSLMAGTVMPLTPVSASKDVRISANVSPLMVDGMPRILVSVGLSLVGEAWRQCGERGLTRDRPPSSMYTARR